MRVARWSVIAGVLIAGATVIACTEFDCVYDATCPKAATVDAGDDAPVVDAALEAEAEAAVVPTNPYGAPYPTEHLGWHVRSGNTSGSVIPNVAFDPAIAARPGGEPGTPVVGTSQLVDFYDPDTRTHDVLMLVLSDAGDTVTRSFFDRLAAPPARVHVLSALGFGYTRNVAPSIEHFKQWSDEHPWATHAMDGRFTKLTALGSAPIVVLIDARTMELAYLAPASVAVSTLNTEILKIRQRARSY